MVQRNVEQGSGRRRRGLDPGLRLRAVQLRLRRGAAGGGRDLRGLARSAKASDGGAVGEKGGHDDAHRASGGGHRGLDRGTGPAAQ